MLKSSQLSHATVLKEAVFQTEKAVRMKDAKMMRAASGAWESLCPVVLNLDEDCWRKSETEIAAITKTMADRLQKISKSLYQEWSNWINGWNTQIVEKMAVQNAVSQINIDRYCNFLRETMGKGAEEGWLVSTNARSTLLNNDHPWWLKSTRHDEEVLRVFLEKTKSISFRGIGALLEMELFGYDEIREERKEVVMGWVRERMARGIEMPHPSELPPLAPAEVWDVALVAANPPVEKSSEDLKRRVDFFISEAMETWLGSQKRWDVLLKHPKWGRALLNQPHAFARCSIRRPREGSYAEQLASFEGQVLRAEMDVMLRQETDTTKPSRSTKKKPHML